MSRFYMKSTNERNKTPRTQGGRKGLTVSINGWNCGLLVTARVNEKGQDVFEVRKTTGSNGSPSTEPFKTIVDKNSAGPRNPKGQLK